VMAWLLAESTTPILTVIIAHSPTTRADRYGKNQKAATVTANPGGSLDHGKGDSAAPAKQGADKNDRAGYREGH